MLWKIIWTTGRKEEKEKICYRNVHTCAKWLPKKDWLHLLPYKQIHSNNSTINGIKGCFWYQIHFKFILCDLFLDKTFDFLHASNFSRNIHMLFIEFHFVFFNVLHIMQGKKLDNQSILIIVFFIHILCSSQSITYTPCNIQ